MNLTNTSSEIFAEETGEGNLGKGLMMAILGSAVFVGNAFVFVALKKCSLGFSSELLMRAQCATNMIVMVIGSTYAPIITIKGAQIMHPENILYGIPGAIAILGVYSGFFLQTLMSINRMVFIGFWLYAENVFSKRNSIIFFGVGMGFSVVYATVVALPCCTLSFQVGSGWAYTGRSAATQGKIVVIGQGILFIVCLLCYAITMLRMRQFRKAIKTQDIASDKAKKEIKVLIAFITTGLWWLIGTGSFFLLLFIPSLKSTPLPSFQTFHRYSMSAVDPVVYALSMGRLRSVLAKQLCGFCKRNSSVGPSDASKGVITIAVEKLGAGGTGMSNLDAGGSTSHK